MSSLRYRRSIPGWNEISSDPPAGGVGTEFRYPRDPAVDESTAASFESVGLAGNPNLPVVLGPQTSELNLGTGSRRTKVGRPGAWKTLPFTPHARDLNTERRGTLAPGTIRRNVRYKVNGSRASGFFSWAANELANVLGFVPARAPQDEYLVSSLHLMLPDSLATVVSGTSKPAPGLEPFRGGETVQGQASTGWPVLAPQIPSYGSRIPLRRPRGLVAVND